MAEINAYTLGQRVVAKVETITTYGVFLRLVDNTRAYCRRRELSWANIREPSALVNIGDEIETEVIRLPSDKQILELSRKNFLTDPWVQFLEKFCENQLITGRVKDVTAYGIFVEILPGVDGLIPANELAFKPLSSADEMFWIDDDVEAIISFIDQRNRKVGLSIRHRLEQLARVTEIVKGLDRHVDAKGLTTSSMIAAEAELLSDFQADKSCRHASLMHLGRILVIEDHDEICGPLAVWLVHFGCQADTAFTAEEARQKLYRSPYNLVILDIDLPDMDGLTLMQELEAHGIRPQTIVMSIPETLAERSGDFNQIDIVAAFVKPLDLDEVYEILVKVALGEPVHPRLLPATLGQTEHLHAVLHLDRSLGKAISLDKRLHTLLARLTKSTGAEISAIFQMEAASKKIKVLAQIGIESWSESDLYALEDSPVKDVILEGNPILERRLSLQAKARFRKLLGLFPFESCIAVPIATHEGVSHALFLFRRRGAGFHRYHLHDALAAADLFAAIIERAALDQRIHGLDKLLLSGQLSAGFGHEVFNKMSGLDLQIRNLQTDFQVLCHSDFITVNHTALSSIPHAIDILLATSNDLRKTVELFRQLLQVDEQAQVNVHAVLKSAEMLLQPTAQRHRVKLAVKAQGNLPTTTVPNVSLRQVFLNIMLNAIQQIALKSREGGLLEIAVTVQAGDRQLPIKVRFTDTGPGVHKQLWLQIFHLGFSTRPNGTGLGLFIAHSLVESFGGRISVEKSIVPVGTTFLVELPVSYQGDTQ